MTVAEGIEGGIVWGGGGMPESNWLALKEPKTHLLHHTWVALLNGDAGIVQIGVSSSAIARVACTAADAAQYNQDVSHGSWHECNSGPTCPKGLACHMSCLPHLANSSCISRSGVKSRLDDFKRRDT